MTEETRDPNLQGWFAQTELPLSDDGFVQQVEEAVAANQYTRWLRLVALAALIALIVASSYSGVVTLSQWLVSAIVRVEVGWLAWWLAPLNNWAAVLGLTCLLSVKFCQRLFRITR